jgi:hypothetical protein
MEDVLEQEPLKMNRINTVSEKGEKQMHVDMIIGASWGSKLASLCLYLCTYLLGRFYWIF